MSIKDTLISKLSIRHTIAQCGAMLFALILTGFSSGVVLANAEQDFEFHGYLRSGLGYGRNGTDQVCFKAEKSTFGKHRLGNECETYAELSFSKSHRSNNQGEVSFFKTNFTLALVSSADRDWESVIPTVSQSESADFSVSSDLAFAMREANVEAHNVLGDGTVVWVGKQYYGRYDLHMIDFYYIDNTGPGFGVKNIDIGSGRLSLALTRNIPKPASGDGNIQTNIDVRLGDIEIGTGKIEVIAIHGQAARSGNVSGHKKFEALSGDHFAAVFSHFVMGGFHKTVIQYGAGLFGGENLNQWGAWGTQSKAVGSETSSRDKSTALRVLSQAVLQPDADIAATFVVAYQNISFGGEKASDGTKKPNRAELSVGLRPSVSVSRNLSLAFEYGYTEVSNAFSSVNDADGTVEYADSKLHKFTIAPEISAGASYWARPQLRLFATYARWNDESIGSIVSKSTYSGEASGFSTGVQVESWW